MSHRSTIRWLVLPLACLGLLVLVAAVSSWLLEPSRVPPSEPTAPPERTPSPPPPSEPVPSEPSPPESPSAPVVPPPAFPSPQSAVPVLPGPGKPDPRRVVEVEPVIESTQGDLRPEDVRAALRAVTPLVQQCFQDSAQRNRGSQTVKLRFQVEARGEDGKGDLGGGEVLSSTIPDPMVQACVQDSLLDVRFSTPSRGGKATVVYPFEFRVPEETGR
ncbi:AgmX/PglI C-terminal domain-containing protein [Myxococcus sp. K15C18031901]|uniref:AgmX/PglI C-terminal domain-containing protein n=1 Tax=Myxococcus dinghuensis TaxID=2906761 RepID=UPI0020A783E4|nr:AgmX/PglI C-terminal domain-containing protein [Myxococcus dinghuensis]MCP3103583.1 AgmX/PglI C-terminal domain-containing protein [Myxococcus dinghuensis]